MIFRSFSLFVSIWHIQRQMEFIEEAEEWKNVKYTLESWNRMYAKLRRKQTRTNGWTMKKKIKYAAMSMKLNNNFRNFYCDEWRVWLTKMETTKEHLWIHIRLQCTSPVHWCDELHSWLQRGDIYICAIFYIERFVRISKNHLIRPNRYWKCTKSLSVQCI